MAELSCYCVGLVTNFVCLLLFDIEPHPLLELMKSVGML
jgi:hypothetical protein